MKSCSLINLTDACLKKWSFEKPHKNALIFVGGDGGIYKYSYKELYSQILKVASGLKSYGLDKGSTFLIRSENALDLILLYFGAIRAELVPLATYSDLTERETQKMLREFDAKLYYQSNLTALTIDLPQGCKSITQHAVKKMLKAEPLLFTPNTTKEDPAFILDASYTHSVVYERKRLLGPSNEVILQTHPFYMHPSLFFQMIDAWINAGTVISLLHFATLSELIPLINHFQVTTFAATPELLDDLNNYWKKHPLSLTTLKTLAIIHVREQIDPKEVEHVLVKEGRLSEAVCLFEKGENQEDALVLFAVLQDKQYESDQYIKHLMEVARKNLAREKLPTRIVFLDKIPRTPSGGVDTTFLRSM